MEVEKLCSASISSLEKMVCKFVVQTALAAQQSLTLLLFMAGFMLDHMNLPPEFAGIEKRFPFSDLNKATTTEPENKDASETEDDENGDSNGESDDDDDTDDDDDESSDGEDDSDDGMPAANGNEGSYDDSEDEDDDSDEDDEDDDEEDDEDEDDDEGI